MTDWKAFVRGRLKDLRLEPTREGGIVDELALHLESAYHQARNRGASEAEAKVAAEKQFADWRLLESEIARIERALPPGISKRVQAWEDRAFSRTGGFSMMLADLWQDVRYGVRTLRKSPGFTAVAVLTLALGIGATTAIFSVVNGVLLRPLSFPNFQRLVTLQGTEEGRNTAWGTSQPDYDDFRAQNASFEEMGLIVGWTFNLTEIESPERLVGSRCSGTLFSVLGAKALLGRTILPADDVPDLNHVLIGYGLWQRVFGGDAGIVGRTIQLNGRAHTIVGVMPPHFQFPAPQTEIWGTLEGNFGGLRSGRFLQAVARLKPGVSREAAQADLSTIAARLARAYPDTNTGWGVRVTPLLDSIVQNIRPTLWIVFGMVGIVLLIACTNVANLQMVRMASRRKEIAVRFALGAGRGRLVRQLLTETLFLALAAGGLSLLLAWGGIQLLAFFRPENLPRLDSVRLDPVVFAFALLISLLAGCAVGLWPVVHLTRKEHVEGLKEGGRMANRSEGQRRLRGVFVVVQLALALILLIGAGLLLRSFRYVVSMQPGFNPERVLMMNVFLTPPKYSAIPVQKEFIRAALERIRTVPGVVDVSATTHPPFGDTFTGLHFRVEGHPTGDRVDPTLEYRVVNPGYFRFMGIPLRRGRALLDTDHEAAPPVLVVNQAMADRFFPGQDPLGERIRWTQYGSEQDWHTIVGVVGNVRAHGLERDPQPAAYAPYRQRQISWMRWTAFLARLAGDSSADTRLVRDALQAVDPNQPVYGVATMEQQMRASLSQRRFLLFLVGLFGSVAVTLAGVGVYGVLSYTVSRRTHEIGVRRTFGARPGQILLQVLRQGMGLALLGVALGAAGAAGLARHMESLLFRVAPTDPVTFIGLSGLLLGVSTLACYLPARRATKVDPMLALRYE